VTIAKRPFIEAGQADARADLGFEQSELFSPWGLDHPNQLEKPYKSSGLEHAVSMTVRHANDAPLNAIGQLPGLKRSSTGISPSGRRARPRLEAGR
jgi:hypothetical protein